jgi:hypothetical protein
VNVTETEQLAPAASVLPHVFAEIAKLVAFVPVSVIPLISSGVVAVFFSTVLSAAAVVPFAMLPKASAVGVSVTAPEAPPVPASATVCGDPATSSATLISAPYVATAAGLNVTPIVHVPPAATCPEHVFDAIAKFPAFAPVSETPLMLIGTPPVLVSTVGCVAEVVPTSVPVNVSDAGANETAPGAAPVPLNPTVCGVPAALSATLIDALSGATDPGLNVNEIEQLAPAATVLPHVFAVIAKLDVFAPVSVTPEIVSVDPPLLVSIVDFAAAVDPLATVPNDSVVGENVTAAAANPVPVSVTACGDPAALSATLIAALSAVVVPFAVNVTEIEQLAPTATLVPQVLAVIAKLDAFAPVSVTAEIVSAAVPLLVSIVVWAALVAPAATLLNVSAAGENVTAGLVVGVLLPPPHPTSAAKPAPIAKAPKIR